MTCATTYPGQTYSKSPDCFPPSAPREVVRAHGPYVYGADGRRWIDYVSGLGAVVLGHGHPAVDAAVREQLGRGVAFPLPTALEEAVAERIALLVPSAERVRFGKNGADATGAAVRIARAATGRQHVAMARGAYHGHHDWSVTRPPKHGGVPKAMLAHTRFFDQGSAASVAALFEAPETRWPAAVVVEPVLSSAPAWPPGEWLADVRRLCTTHGALLVFDEVVTGMRVPHYTVQRHTGVTPDLTALGKAIANGLPLSAVAGPADLMDRTEADVFFSVTHGGEALSLAAARATLDEAVRAGLPERLSAAGRRIRDAVGALANEYGVDASLAGYDARPVLRLPDALRPAFLDGVAACRVLAPGYFNLTLAHDDDHVFARTREALRAGFEAAARRAAA